MTTTCDFDLSEKKISNICKPVNPGHTNNPQRERFPECEQGRVGLVATFSSAFCCSTVTSTILSLKKTGKEKEVQIHKTTWFK